MRKLCVSVAMILLGSIFTATPATAAPAIEFLNPSEYSTTMKISNAQDRDDRFHLVAWVATAPPGVAVEFQVQPAAGNEITIDATAVPGTSDTFQSFWNIPASVPDGQYTMQAVLYSNGNQVGEPDSELVTINRDDLQPPPLAETVEMTHPSNGGEIGFHASKSGKTNAIIEITGSAGAEQARVFYTLSRPGAEPEWVGCGSGELTERTGNIRCTLASGANPTQVTAIAAVANNTPPPGTAQGVADDSGDAHRVTPYLQVPSTVTVSPTSSRAEPGKCHGLTARITDQKGKPVADLNVDVHASGPGDNIRFGVTGTGPRPTPNFQPPDKGSHGVENAALCSDGTNHGQQGDHNVPVALRTRSTSSRSTWPTTMLAEERTTTAPSRSSFTRATSAAHR